MNEYNHHRIIERFAAKEDTLSDDDVQILKDASNYTDDFGGFSNKWPSVATQNEFYFYHFYYDIKCENNTIMLSRNNHDEYNMDKSINRCEYLQDGNANYYESRKKFFTTINEREDFARLNEIDSVLLKGVKGEKEILADSSNQSESVAFLHAMGASGPFSSFSETEERSKTVFVEHLERCFAEFLFIKDRKKALFLLGIALHGIMDSFTPSHTGFQKYASQDMGLHAQGDVVPIKGAFDEKTHKLISDTGKKQVIEFDPGDYLKESIITRNILDRLIKGYNHSDKINEKEYDMLKIFFFISDIEDSYGNYYARDWNTFVRFWKSFREYSIDQINDILRRHYQYGEKAYRYSESAIKAMVDVHECLTKGRQLCLNNYDYFKNNKIIIINEALQKWETEYICFQEEMRQDIKILKSLFKSQN